MNRQAHDIDASPATTELVVDVALESFARHGFDDTRLEAIAQESGMTKRMIHYHFGDKRGLYLRALLRAVQLLRPNPEALELGSSVPVDGVQQIVEALYGQMILQPAACRLFLMENLFSWADLSKQSPVADQSEVLLALDKLLMLGQDSGAFRPGISALDVYTIIASMCAFRVSNRATFKNLYSLDLADEANTIGLRRLVVDTVLSFLTSNMASTGMSYLTEEAPAWGDDTTEDSGNSGLGDIYGDSSDFFSN